MLTTGRTVTDGPDSPPLRGCLASTLVHPHPLGIPELATHYMFAYPLTGLDDLDDEQLRKIDLKREEVLFVVFGGYAQLTCPCTCPCAHALAHAHVPVQVLVLA